MRQPGPWLAWAFGNRSVPAAGLVGYSLIFLYPWEVLQAQRRLDQGMQRLVETYPEQLEGLEVAFGRHLRTHYPDVRSAHRTDRLDFRRDADGHRLTFDLAEPIRRGIEWGGARLEAWRGQEPVRLPLPDLFLTYATGGRQAEWVARASRGLLGHRLAICDDLFVADTCRRVF